MSTQPRPSFLPAALRWGANALTSWVYFLSLLLVAPFSRRAAYAIYQSWGRMGYRIFGIKLHLRDDNEGLSDHSPKLYVWLNQSSLAEAFVFTLLLPPHRSVTNLGYASIPFVGWGRALVGDVVIIRQWKAQAKRGIERLAELLVRGENGLISVEGERSPDGRLQPYKKGTAVLAIKAQATIIPMVLRGGHEIMPVGEWRIRPGTIELHLLKAIPTRGLIYEDRDTVLEQLRLAAERELLGTPSGTQQRAQEGRRLRGAP